MTDNTQINIHDVMNWQQNLFLSIAKPYLQTLDSLDSQYDESSVKRKDDIWSKITEEYNTKCSSEPLTTDIIQKYYKLNKTKEKDANFTKQDEELLLKITAEYKHIITSVQSDTESLQGKEVAWAEITIQFNAQCSNDHLQTKKFLRRYYESRFIQPNSKCEDQEEDNTIKTEEVLLKDELFSEIVADVHCPDVLKSETEKAMPEQQPVLENVLISVKEENIEDADEPALAIEEVNLRSEIKEELNDEEDTAVDPMEISDLNLIRAPEDEELSQSEFSEEDSNPPAKKRTHEKAFGPAFFLESSSSSSSSNDESNELNRFMGYETKLRFLQDKLEMNRQHQLRKLDLEEQKLLLNLEMQENRLRQFKEETDLRLKLLELDVEITKKQLELTRKSKQSK